MLSTKVAEYQWKVLRVGFQLKGGGIQLQFSISRSLWPGFDKLDKSGHSFSALGTPWPAVYSWSPSQHLERTLEVP